MYWPIYYRRVILLLLFCFLFIIGYCQKIETERDYAISHYTEDNGLNRNRVHTALVDEEGFLWVISDYSLQRFDGKKFFNAATNGSIRFSIALGHFDRVKKYGTVLITEDTMMLQYANNTFLPTYNKLDYNKRLYLYNGSLEVKDRFFDILKVVEPKFTDRNIRNGKIMHNDTFALRLSFGIAIFTPNKLIKVISIDDTENFGYAVLGKRLVTRHQDSLFVYDTKGKLLSMKIFPKAFGKKISTIQDLANQSHYLYINDVITRCTISLDDRIQLTPILKIQLKDSILGFWQKDRNTKIITTASSGVYVLKKKNFVTQLTKDVHHANDFYSQYVLHNKLIGAENYVVTENGLRRNAAAGNAISNRFVLVSADKKRYWYSSGNRISGPLLVGNYPGDPESKMITTTNIIKAFLDNEENVWSFSENYMYAYTDSNKFKIKGPAPINVYHLLDLDSFFLVSAYHGLFRLNKKNGSFYAYPEFNNHQVRYCIKGKDSIVWVFTYGKGFFALINGRKIAINLDAQKKLNLSHYMFIDSLNRAWIPTNNGLFVTLYSELVKNAYDSTYHPFYYRFEKSAGFVTNEFNGAGIPPYVQLPNGTVSMPSMQGLVLFNPNKTLLPFTKGIALDKVLYNNIPVASLNNIVIPNTAQNITFLISAMDYQISPNVLVDFQLVEAGEEPLPNAWQPLNSDDKITLSSIQPDQYRLIIRQRIGLGPNDFFYKNIEFSIPLHWYQTNLFFIALGMLLIVTFSIAFKIRTRLLQKKNQKLEETVQAAVSNLEQTLNALQDSNAQKDKLFSIIAHDLKSPINNLISVLQHTENNLLTAEDVTKTLKEVKKDATVIQKTLDNLLNWSLLQMGIKHFRKEKIKVLSFLTIHTKLYSKLAKEKNIDIRIECDKSIVIEADRNQLSLIIRNFIDNAIKFTPPNGTITAGVQQKFFTYKIFVSNTGPAISEAAINKILYSGEMSSTPGTAKEKGTGLGLQLCKEFITNLNSRLEIYISEDQQTVFAFEIALQNSNATA